MIGKRSLYSVQVQVQETDIRGHQGPNLDEYVEAKLEEKIWTFPRLVHAKFSLDLLFNVCCVWELWERARSHFFASSDAHSWWLV